MRINAISRTNYHNTSRINKIKHKEQEGNPTITAPTNDTVEFKGAKGAAIGAACGLAYMGCVALMAGPFAVLLGPGFYATSAGACALAGHAVEENRKNLD